MLFGLFKDKEMVIPDELYEFPKYDGSIKSGPTITNTNKYIRATYYVSNVNDYIQKILAMGYIQKSDVRYDRNDQFNYIIIEKEGSKYKIAFHKTKIGL